MSRFRFGPNSSGCQEQNLSADSLHGELKRSLPHEPPHCPDESTGLPHKIFVAPGRKSRPVAAPLGPLKRGSGLPGTCCAAKTKDADICVAPGPLLAGSHALLPSQPSNTCINKPASANEPSEDHGAISDIEAPYGERRKRALTMSKEVPGGRGGGRGAGGGGGGEGGGGGG